MNLVNQIKFAVLSYYPSVIATENMNIGIIFLNVNSNERKFFTLKNWSRLQSFDDEVDIGFMKDYLKGMKSQIEENLINRDKVFDLEEFIRHYVNELRFSEVQNVFVEDADDFIMLTRKVHMRNDFDLKERLNQDSELRYIKMIMRSNNVEFSNKPVVGIFDENILFDYTVGDLGFKNFVFEDKNIKSMITTAKYWAYNALTLKDKYRTVFVYDDDSNNSSEFKIIMNILRANAFKVIKGNEVMNFLINEENLKLENQTEFSIQLN